MNDRDAALEEIRVVREMIHAARQRVRGAWVPFLTFGLLGVAASLASHRMIAEGAGLEVALVWVAFVVLGLAIVGLWTRRAGSDGGTTFVGRMLVSLWSAITLALGALWIGAIAGGVGEAGAIGTMIVLGIGVFVSGRLLDYAPLAWGAGLWWLGAIAGAIRPDLIFAIEACAIAVSYLLPAWGLYRQEVSEAHAA